jgi:capsular exopolysaccharide synthesis family protein
VPNLYFLTAGSKPPNPARLLESQRFKSLITEARSEYHYIIIDAPPVLPVPDTAVLSPIVDGILIVVRYAQTNSDYLKRANNTLKLAKAKIIGAVMNDVNIKEGRRYGYGYGYGYGYYDDETP